MAKYIAIIVSLIFFVFSVNSVFPENVKEVPSVEIIKGEDAEEGRNIPHLQDTNKTSVLRRRFLESLVCKDPKSESNDVTDISGDPFHMGSKVKVTCKAGKHFINQSANKTMVTATCQPLPHPCMCMAAWTTQDDFQLMYDFNCTSDIDDNIDKETESAKDEFPIYPLQDKNKDDPQCPDPTPIRGTMKILHGHPFSYGCNVLLTCDPGLVFEDGKSVWNLTCLGLSVLPPQCAWVPMHDGQPVCKDLQCPDPSPVRGRLKVLSGKPFTDGCEVSLICDPGLVFSDGKAIWNLSCTPVPHIPPAVFWIPQYSGRPTCREPEVDDTDKETTQSENGDSKQNNIETEVVDGEATDDDKQTVDTQGIHSNDDLQCPDPTPVRGTMKILHGHPYSYGCNVLLTCDPGLVFEDGESVWNLTCLGLPVMPPTIVWVPTDKGKPICREPGNTEVTETETNTGDEENLDNQIIPDQETADSHENLENINQVEVDYFEPEEDLDGTFHENYIEATDSEETNMKDNEEIILPLGLEAHEEFTNAITDFESEEYEDQQREEPEEVGSEYEQNTSQLETDETSEIENIMENESVQENEKAEINEPRTLHEENDEEDKSEERRNDEGEIEEKIQIQEEVKGDAKEISEEENYETEQETENDEEAIDADEEETEKATEQEGEEEEEEEEPEFSHENDNEIVPTEKDSEQEEHIKGEEELEDETYQENAEHVKDVSDEHSEYLKEEEEEYEEENGISLDDVYPPRIKEPSIIYTAIKESYLLDKEENEDGVEDVENDSLMFWEAEPPGNLLDIQMVPVEASNEEIRTNEDHCSLPAETGPCRAYFRRFFFNSKTQECDVYVYGGCNGNGNNFKTLDDCENACGRKKLNL